MSTFSHSEVRSTVTAALFAVVMSTLAVTSAVGPARAAERTPVSVAGPVA